ncbi:MAG: hypothetical protein KC496_02865 [Anaerolineae bacterium]|nr:hypothetical protein [Anaerolineae bacterium]
MSENEQPITPPEDETAPEKVVPDSVAPSSIGDDIDVESALAAVASLHTLTQEDEATAEAALEDDAEALDSDSEYDDLPELYREADELAPVDEAPASAVAPVGLPLRDDRLLRGQAASVIPAFLLIGMGAVLTFWLTTGSELPSTLTLFGGGLIALGIMLLSRWFSTRTQGSLFMGLLLALLGGLSVYWGNSASSGWLVSWPLLLSAPGLALLLSSLATRGSRSAVLVGLILTASGLVVILMNQVLPELDSALAPFWPVALGIGIVLLIAPVLRRQRN